MGWKNDHKTDYYVRPFLKCKLSVLMNRVSRVKIKHRKKNATRKRLVLRIFLIAGEWYQTSLGKGVGIFACQNVFFAIWKRKKIGKNLASPLQRSGLEVYIFFVSTLDLLFWITRRHEWGCDLWLHWIYLMKNIIWIYLNNFDGYKTTSQFMLT